MRGIVGVALCGLAGCNLLFKATADDDPTGGDDAAVSLDCPARYRLPNTMGYSVSMTPRGWLAAELDCENDGVGIAAGTFTHLAIVDSQSELELVADFAQMTDVWIGLTDHRTENKFIAIANQANPFPDPDKVGSPPWLDGEPDDDSTSNDQDCAVIAGAEPNGRLADEDCTMQRVYVCECDRNAPDPTRFPPTGPPPAAR